MDTHATIEVLLETLFFIRFMQRSYQEDNWDNQVSSVRGSVKKRGSWKGAAIREDLSAEPEESPLLEAVAREQLVKPQQAGEDLVCAVVICKV
jgi:hypothetical protein